MLLVGCSHSDYLLSLVTTCLNKCQQEGYGCTVRSLVTDNAENMRKMRQDLSTSKEAGVEDITYRSSSRILNLVVYYIDLPLITQHKTNYQVSCKQIEKH